MKDALYNLLTQETVEFANVSKESSLSACIHTQMGSYTDCQPGK